MRTAEINRDLRNSDPMIRKHIFRMQEKLSAMEQTIKQQADLLIMLYGIMENLHAVNTKLNDRWERRLRGENPDDDLVKSVDPSSDLN